MIRKNSLLPCFAFLLGTATFANTPGENLVTLSPSVPGFEFNIAAVWLKPGASNLNYVIFNKELPAQSPTWTEQEVQPSFTPGFELGMRYTFPCAIGRDIRLTWTHLNTNDSDTTVTPDSSYFLGPDYEIGPTGIPIRNAKGWAKFNYDVVNLDVGQNVNFGQQLAIRFFARLSGASLLEKVKAVYTSASDAINPFSTTQEVRSRFNGVGPRFGLAAKYDTCFCGLGLMGEVGAALLIGSMDAKTSYTSSSALLEATFDQLINNQFIKDETVYQVIPGFDAKLGVNYQYWFANQMKLTITAGYQAAVYVNAISQYLPASLVEPLETGGIYVDTMAHRLSNYSVQGPFLDFALKI